MVNKNKQNKNGWLFSPGNDHSVQFYPSDNALIENLGDYIHTGLTAHEACIVIATETHIEQLDEWLRHKRGIPKQKYIRQYTALDAQATLDSFMVNDLPDEDLFANTVGKLLKTISKSDKPIRAYGEMVALLWKADKKEAVLQLEELWNELAANYDFSLYCAYPELHFMMDQEVREEISQRHNLQLADGARTMVTSQ